MQNEGENTQKISYTSWFVYKEEEEVEEAELVGEWAGSWYINKTKLNIIIVVIISQHHNKSLYMDID